MKTLCILFLVAPLVVRSRAAEGVAGVSAGSGWYPQTLAAEIFVDPSKFPMAGMIVAVVIAVIMVIGATLAAINGAITLVEKIRGSKKEAARIEQPVVVKHEVRLATWEELNQLRAETDRQFEDLGKAIETLAKAGQDRGAHIESTMKEDNQATRDLVTELNAKVYDLAISVGGIRDTVSWMKDNMHLAMGGARK